MLNFLIFCHRFCGLVLVVLEKHQTAQQTEAHRHDGGDAAARDAAGAVKISMAPTSSKMLVLVLKYR